MKAQLFPSFLSLTICFLLPVLSFTQGGWTASPFEQKVFIENKGQFDTCLPDRQEKLENGSKVLFGASSEGVELYFTSKGLTYRHDVLDRITELWTKEESESNSPNEAKEEENERTMVESIPHYLSMEWVGANPNIKITAREPVSFYYTYGGAGKDASTTIKANACKKIVYKNLYPNIDVEYIFPENDKGIKYTLIVHPGGDPSLIKMKYSTVAATHPPGDDTESLALDEKKNIIITCPFGNFVDHAPVTFYQSDKSPVISSFILNESEVSFHINGYDRSRTLVIDPWVTNPAFVGSNSAYDVNFDLNGNVYIHGSYSPFKLVKLNSAGVIQWTYNAVGLGNYNASSYVYGDFALDEVSGTSYLVEGYMYASGARVFKVDASGNQTGTFAGDPNMTEMCRAEYNRCINKIVIAAGSNKAPYQAAMLDTNLNITPVNVLATTESLHDFALLAIDNSKNFCYMATNKRYAGNNINFDNILVKSPLPNLLPLAFSVPDGHKLIEVASVTYVSNNGENGMNGMAASPGWLYTYNSDSLKRWNKNTGAFSAGVDVSPAPPSYGTKGQVLVLWGGLSADECDNIYVGVQSSIKQYNSSLALVNTFVLPDRVYDVKLGPNNNLYACGRNFVTSIAVASNNTAVTVTQTPNSGCGVCTGSAAATISCGNLSGFNYSWSTSPVQTTATATGLCPGTYTVVATTNCFISFTGTVTVTGNFPPLTTNISATTPDTCNNNKGVAAVNVGSGTAPYTYNWSPSGGNNTLATGLNAGTYTIMVTDANGCTSSQTVAITSIANTLSVSITSTPAGCTVNNGTATAIPSSGTPAYSYNWSLPAGQAGNSQVTQTATGLGAGTYSVTVIDAHGCSQTQAIAVTSASNPIATANATPLSINQGDSTHLIATGGGTYQWSPSAGLSCMTCANPTAMPLQTTTYCVLVTDSNGCSNTACIAIEVLCGTIYIPNAFSPNNDTENELECVMGGCIQTLLFTIYDRWGEKVFETTDQKICWDGTYKGKPMNTAVFAYYLQATFISGETITKKGNISLLR